MVNSKIGIEIGRTRNLECLKTKRTSRTKNSISLEQKIAIACQSVVSIKISNFKKSQSSVSFETRHDIGANCLKDNEEVEDGVLQSKCFFLGPISSSVVALQTALARPWPANECFAAKIRSFNVCPVFILKSWVRTSSPAVSQTSQILKLTDVHFGAFNLSSREECVNMEVAFNCSGVEGGFLFVLALAERERVSVCVRERREREWELVGIETRTCQRCTLVAARRP